MESVPVPHLTIKLSIELDVEYNPFKGKTEEEYAKHLEEEVGEILFEISPNVKKVYTSIVAIDPANGPEKV
jgi:hypothetical protein